MNYALYVYAPFRNNGTSMHTLFKRAHSYVYTKEKARCEGMSPEDRARKINVATSALAELWHARFAAVGDDVS